MDLTVSRLASRFSHIDQDRVIDVIRELKQTDDSVLFMPTNVRSRSDIVVGTNHITMLTVAHMCGVEDAECKIDVPNADLMFVYQSAEMKRLYKRYGNLLVVLDAVYRADRYPLPLFFLLVRTNVNYQVVAVIVLQQETQQSLVSALRVIQNWNPDVYPRFALVDLSEEEVAALPEAFPGIEVHVSDFHREQAWQRWISKCENVAGVDADGIKSKLRRIVNAVNVDDMSRALAEFESSVTFTGNVRLVNWFSNVWKPHLMRWSTAYRSGQLLFLLLTNHGTRNMAEDFRHEFLNSCTDVSLSALLSVMLRQHLPSLRGTYVELNVRSSSLYRKYNEDVPQYLRNRPRCLIDDMRKKMIAVETSAMSSIEMKSDGVFLVTARVGRPPHEVVFGDEFTCCSCNCQSFQRTQLLCVHFCAVFRAFPDWTFERVSPLYTQSPLLTLDEDILQAGASFVPPTSNAAASDARLSSPSQLRLLRSEKQKARELLRSAFEMTYSLSDVNLLQKLVQRLEPIQKEMSEHLSAHGVIGETVSKGSTLVDRDSSRQKHKLQFKRYMLPQKKRVSETGSEMNVIEVGSEVNVIEVHVIDGSEMTDVPMSGPTFTV